MRRRRRCRSARISTALATLLLAVGCTEPEGSAPEAPYYDAADFASVRKFDSHVHANNPDASFLSQAREDNFELLSINVDYADFPPLEQQERDALSLLAVDPERFHFAATFPMTGWGSPGWPDSVNARLDAALRRGAVAVKTWKNIGMTARNARGDLIMVDDRGLDPVFAHLQGLGVPVIGHQGEPRNCWLPLDAMTTRSDREYFRRHPQYHMYLHPELPSYEDQMAARDHRLARMRGLHFVGAHLASLEWSVDRLDRFLETHPNASVDMARMTQLQYQSVREPAKVRAFLIRHQDRIVYGTDLIFGPADEPGPFRRHAHAVWISDWLYLATPQVQRVDDIDADVRGLHLPRSVIDKIYWANAERIFLRSEP